ncbi:FHA domain-containing protein [Leisingera sp. S232]|uniref:FHA domain-containing protein n=1 Tax=Leisingera sp. S232 TaxID=3415132 RepID=UPI003C7A10B6
MKRPGPASTRNAALLLTSAAIVDLFLLIMVVDTLLPKLGPLLLRHMPVVDKDFHGILLLATALPVSWLLYEFLLRGLSPGRFLFGLQLRNKSGLQIGWPRLLFRAFHKIAFAGLGGVNPLGESHYDRLSGAQWFTPLCPPIARPMKEWELQICSGSLQGKSVQLKQFKTNSIKIGRDKNWTNLRFSEADSKVSRRHCMLLAAKGSLWLRDGDGKGSFSSSGTFLETRRLKPGEIVAIGKAEYFTAGDVEIRILR